MSEKIKRITLIPSCLISLFLIGSAQDVIKNSGKPNNPQAGRTVTVKEVMRIKDDGEKAVFKIPRHLHITEDNSILFLDLVESSNLYKYDRNGQLVFKILKGGQGPQECQWASNFMLHENGIRVWAYNPPKVLDYDRDGQFIAEIKTQRRPGLYFFGDIDGKMYGIFDMEGNFMDSFYLQFPSTHTNHFYGDMRISDDGYIYTIEQNKDDGLVSIGKYRIEDFDN